MNEFNVDKANRPVKQIEIVRVINGGDSVPVERRPKHVWSVLGEESVDGILNGVPLKQWYNGFIEDQFHDWEWKNGNLRFYGHSGSKGDSHILALEY